MRAPAVWLQWTVVFTILGTGAWLVYPAIDPFVLTANKHGLLGLRQEFFSPNTSRKGSWIRQASNEEASAVLPSRLKATDLLAD